MDVLTVRVVTRQLAHAIRLRLALRNVQAKFAVLTTAGAAAEHARKESSAGLMEHVRSAMAFKHLLTAERAPVLMDASARRDALKKGKQLIMEIVVAEWLEVA
ncbi:MAG: hypothetical protein NTZ02_04025 [Candidatus Woesearchaeota archaeon]|nr:hypothetical protein [Candidatus Woesearchaeota archaeon]